MDFLGEDPTVTQNRNSTDSTDNQSVSQSVSQSEETVTQNNKRVTMEQKGAYLSLRVPREVKDALAPYIKSRRMSQNVVELIQYWLSGKRGLAALVMAIKEHTDCRDMDDAAIKSLLEQREAILKSEAKKLRDVSRLEAIRLLIRQRFAFLVDVQAVPSGRITELCVDWAKTHEVSVEDVRRIFKEEVKR
jgi:hypothetical protein